MTAGLPLIVTRAEPGASATLGRAVAIGLDALTIPLFAARAAVWTVPDPGDFDALLLTSARAAQLAGPGLGELISLPVYAVGGATAAAAEAAGLDVALIGEEDAQSLLDAMASQKIARILWLCGRDRSVFDASGATLAPLACYAVHPIDPPAAWHERIASPAVLLAHSVRGAERIDHLVGAMRGHLALVAISPAVAAAAGTGWAALAVAGRPDDAAMLAEAYALCHKRE